MLRSFKKWYKLYLTLELTLGATGDLVTREVSSPRVFSATRWATDAQDRYGSCDDYHDRVSHGVNAVQELSGGTPTANLLTGLGIDEVLQRTDSAGPWSFLMDGLGSTFALTDSAGLVQGEYTYEPFGKTTATGAASTNAFKYTGREDDGPEFDVVL
jgi:hypothetical protein